MSHDDDDDDGSCQGRVMRFSPVQSAWEMEIEGVKMLLGVWWMEVHKSKLSWVFLDVYFEGGDEGRGRGPPRD